ncbi:MAG: TOBE domain-containing protein [Gemmatimonadales bacterium]|nr:TOBE domain-containing protein [Gemmatimonadales bacterium]
MKLHRFALAPPAVAPDVTAVLGIRPEAIRPAGTGPGVDATVIDIEPLGHEALVTVDAAGTALTMRAESGAVLTVGQPVRIAFQPGEAHWFDGTTGERTD